MKNSKLKFVQSAAAFCVLHFAFFIIVKAQENPPAPSAPKTVHIPAVKEKKLPNGLTVAVVERKNVPLVTVQLLINGGAEMENTEQGGLANMTAALLTKGTKTRTATQIAEQIEFLGGSIDTGANWNNSIVSINVMADKLDQALAIMSDVVLNPAFKQEEIDLLKSQTLDSLTYNLKQPGFLATYVASRYSFDEHPAGGTPDSLSRITRDDISNFKQQNYEPKSAILIFAGDITLAKANALTQKYFSKWKNLPEQSGYGSGSGSGFGTSNPNQIVKRILVVDLPDSGQASVNYIKKVSSGRTNYNAQNKYETGKNYFPALVLNSVLGGGYSSRLNQEIRIKRGLSYGAGSSFAWRYANSNFGTRTQTKNESAAEVAELVLAEVKKLTEGSIVTDELTPRKSVLTGGFGRNLETTEGLAAAVADLYSFGLPTSELNSYTKNVQSVTDAQIRDFANQNLKLGDIIIVGDYAKFKDDLAKRFPTMQVDVIRAADLDLSKDNLRKN